jgi:hypothetical protein
MMCSTKARRQAERAGTAPTLSVAVAGGVALHMHNHPNSNIGEDYANYEGDTLIECLLGFGKVLKPILRFLSHVITSPLPVPRLEAVSETTRIIMP